MRHTAYLISIIFLFFTFFISPSKTYAADWYYPMSQYQTRIKVKDFGTFINDAFYKGKESLFPYNRFYGYHAAVDLEVFDNEKDKDAPFYAVGKGKITYVGNLAGYGGVILESLDGENRTALYGHVRISDFPLKVGDEVSAGQKLAYLGKAFSTETSGERKHLHFGIHKGTDLYFKGHEATLGVLNTEWENPTVYLEGKGAIDPTIVKPSVSSSPSASNKTQVQSNAGSFDSIINFFKRLFKF